MNDALYTKLIHLVSTHLGVDEAEITPSSHLQEDLNADPLSLADLLVKIEEEFQVKIPNEQASKFAKVEDIIDFISDQTGEI